MTRDEAAKILAAKYECIKREVSCTDLDCIYRACAECDLCYEQGTSGEQIEALEMAIKALEDPDQCEDAVSRKDVIDLYKCGAERIAKANGISVEDLPHNGLDVLMNLPSVTPKCGSKMTERRTDEGDRC